MNVICIPKWLLIVLLLLYSDVQLCCNLLHLWVLYTLHVYVHKGIKVNKN